MARLKVCSFLPAVTQMMYDMGLQDYLIGVTFECPTIALREKKPVVRCILEGKSYSSQQIDTFFTESKREGKELYYVDEKLLEEIAPDIIFTQDVCDICQIDMDCTMAAVAHLPKQPELISISPAGLSDVFENALTIAKALGAEEKAYQYLAGLQYRIDAVVDGLREHRDLPKSVALLEWLDPIYNCGHWIPHQIAFAGGVDMLSHPSGNSIAISWDRIRQYDPEIMIVAPCGFDTQRTLKEMSHLFTKDGWTSLKAVKNKRVYIADFELFTQSSAGTLVDGIELLAGLFHPDYLTVPSRLQTRFQPFFEV
ncbi:ABC transporter substrate-binding protein [Cytophaga sp. FL35]|uniref:ABC transporter substrate-binding protein n=1 Tax=Cytophaga sp. FL35 TaxID=1904456 RepID=UPI0016537AB7|nr:ABC transporter substrate-binding protein [Cytophaga sp. FL35]MBC6998642.1 ABC transporter substrate-binding protein [Cytophaga sp. FL35]